MLPLLKYTVLRLALFVATLVLLTFFGAGQVVALVGAAVVSFLLSYVLLRGPREQVAERIAERVDRRHLRGPSAADEDAAVEDAAVEDAADEDAADEDAAGDGATGGTPPPGAESDAGGKAKRTSTPGD